MKITNDIIFQEPNKTFMEILKVNNREVPFANILAFFFRPKENHGLKTIFLDSLIETNYKNIGNDVNGEIREEFEDYDKNSVRVIVENKTDNKNRIDLLIETDKFVICIEFKINHKLNNPLEDYKEYTKLYFENKKKFYFVLTPFKKEPIEKAEQYFVKNNEFKQIILNHFINKVKEKIAVNDTEFNKTESFNYFHDFIKTIENREIRYKRNIYLENLRNSLEKENIKSEYHKSIKGGFLEIKKMNSRVKIRFTTNGVQIENWNDKEKMLIFGPDKNLDENRLIEIIKTSR